MDAGGSGMTARGRALSDLYDEANRLFEQRRHPECERICHLLLSNADLSDYHKAGCHSILSLGSDNFVHHAEQALDLYIHLYEERPGSSFTSSSVPPTHGELEAQQAFVDFSRKALAKAQEDQKKIREDYERQFERFRQAHGREPTTSELVQAHWNRYAGELEQYFNEFDNDLAQFYLDAKSTDREGDKEAAKHDEMEVEKVDDEFKEIFKKPAKVAAVESDDDDDDDDDDDFPYKPFTSPTIKPAGSHSH